MTFLSSVPILRVTDIRASEVFYCSVLGFMKRGEYAASTEGPWYVALSRGESRLHLSSFAGDGPAGVAVYFYVEDVDALYRDFKQSGLKDVELEPTDQSWGRRELYVRDPDGHCLRFGAPSK
jgi:uncharacterized glyoxalase superfamily protein PhnB